MEFYDFKKILKKIEKEMLFSVIELVQRHTIDMSAKYGALPEKKPGEYDVKEVLNVPYINHEEIPLAMDIFCPETGNNDPIPIFFVAHGGGLVTGDRRLSRKYGVTLARKGYLVFSFEYRLIPQANVVQELDDITSGFNFALENIEKYNGDRNRVYISCESAGAFLLLYATATMNNPEVREQLKSRRGVTLPDISIKGIGLICGMLYTALNDPIGVFFTDMFSGDVPKEFRSFTNPEVPEIINRLPPVFLVTSNGDFLNNYTLMYYKALKAAGKAVKLKYYGSKKLEHAFVTLFPELPESNDAIDCMLNWFKSQVSQETKEIEKEGDSNNG